VTAPAADGSSACGGSRIGPDAHRADGIHAGPIAAKNRSGRGSPEWSKTVSGGPWARMRPWFMKTTQSATSRAKPDACDHLDVCRPLGVEVYRPDPALLDGWTPPARAAYRNLHGLRRPDHTEAAG